MIAYLTKSDASEVCQALHLDDAESIDCLPNEEIFAELARMGYEKPSTKLTFYKAFFSAQWKFLIHTNLQCMSAKRTAWNVFSSSMALAVIRLATGRKFNFSKYIFDSLVRNVDSSSKFYMYPRFLQLMIAAQFGDLSSHTTKYTSLTLTEKVFANMRKIGKGFSGVDTPLFERMLVPQQAADDATNVAANDVDDVVAVDAAKPTLPSPTPTSPPPSQELPSTLQVATTPPPSLIAQPSSPPQQQPTQPSHDAAILMDLLNTLLETCTTLTKKVEALEQDKIAHALKITKLKQRVRRLEKKRKLKVSGLKRLWKDDEPEPAELKEVIEVVTTAKLMTEVFTAAATTITATPSAARRRKGVVIRDPEETAIPSTIVHSKPKSKDKGKGILDDVIEQVKRKEKEDNEVLRYQALKKKPQTEAHARKNMMNFNSVVGFLEKSEKELEEEASRALKRKTESSEQQAARSESWMKR
nr:hypothetical protein [Tanacetum cinerariifolium]